MKIFDRLQNHRTLSIMPTFQCTAECTHCGTVSSPREKTWLSLECMLDAIDQAANNGYEVVVFTGGEPTLAGKNLLLAIERATARGLITRVVTNAYWAVNEKGTKSRISDLTNVGLHEINYSTGDQHTRFVPLDNVIRATRGAVEKGLPVSIMVETVKERTVTKQMIEDHPAFKIIRQDFPQSYINIHESPWMPLSPFNIQKYVQGLTVNRENLSLRTGCDSILSTTTIQADGKIGVCCGLGMRIIPELHAGNIHDTTIAEADQMATDDFLKRWIRVEGPERIVAWAASYDADIKWEDMYAHRCQACIRLYKDPKIREIIREHYQEKIADVLFAEWLLFHIQ